MRRGWTTGACAAAAARAACAALVGDGTFPDPVCIELPRGQRPYFALAEASLEDAHTACVGIIKDAGDDPDITHGVLVRARVRRLSTDTGIRFIAGEGVGTITRPGLPLPPGEPAINPGPRAMIAQALHAEAPGMSFSVEISIPGGEQLSARTLNPRLGIVGGLSVLGTTGVVIPYSCAAWIDSIHRGIDVARAIGLTHIAGSTGTTSEAAVAAWFDLPQTALIEMGDFVGGMLKYLRRHPVERVTLAGGVAKMSKLAQGRLDLHSRRGAVDLAQLAHVAQGAGASTTLCEAICHANTTAEAFQLARAQAIPLADAIAAAACATAREVLRTAPIQLDVLIFDRNGVLVGHTDSRAN